jgi:hypothetical protein
MANDTKIKKNDNVIDDLFLAIINKIKSISEELKNIGISKKEKNLINNAKSGFSSLQRQFTVTSELKEFLLIYLEELDKIYNDLITVVDIEEAQNLKTKFESKISNPLYNFDIIGFVSKQVIDKAKNDTFKLEQSLDTLKVSDTDLAVIKSSLKKFDNVREKRNDFNTKMLTHSNDDEYVESFLEASKEIIEEVAKKQEKSVISIEECPFIHNNLYKIDLEIHKDNAGILPTRCFMVIKEYEPKKYNFFQRLIIKLFKIKIFRSEQIEFTEDYKNDMKKVIDSANFEYKFIVKDERCYHSLNSLINKIRDKIYKHEQ